MLRDGEIELELSILDREARTKVLAKMQAQQLGELFGGLDDRRAADTHMRGPDRRVGTREEYMMELAA